MQRVRSIAIAASIAALAALTGPSLAEELPALSAEDLADPPQELEGVRVKIDGGRVFAATPRSAVLKIDGVYLTLSFDEAGEGEMPWRDCQGLAPVEECRVAVTGVLVLRPEARTAELHEAAVEE